MTNIVDVSHLVEMGDIDGESLVITKCICGAKFDSWDFFIDVYRDDPRTCPKCGARLYWTCKVKVFEVIDVEKSGGSP